MQFSLIFWILQYLWIRITEDYFSLPPAPSLHKNLGENSMQFANDPYNINKKNIKTNLG